MTHIDLAGQPRRRHDYLARVRRFAAPHFNAKGEWIATKRPPGTREWQWAAFAFLDGDENDAKFADRLILNAPELGEPYSIFANTHALHLLVTHGGAFSEPARRRLETWARLAIEDSPGGARADLQFHGYNDNMPAKATLGLILGGEYFDDPRALRHGLWNLHQLRRLLTRRGVISEHCSPTYSPLTLTNLAEIVQHARHAEARELAAACCEHIWAELLAHYHAPTRAVVGPYSRAYATDSTGHLGNLAYLLWQVFGPGFAPDPSEHLFDPASPAIIHHSGDRFFVATGFAFLAACEHHPSRRLLDWVGARALPFGFRATTERAEGSMLGKPGSFSANRITIAAHQEPDFAMGTSNGDWLHQAEHWHLVYRRSERPLPGLADIRHLTMRYLVDDTLPGQSAPSPRGEAVGEIDYVPENAFYHTLQKDGVTLVAGGPLDDLARRAHHRLALAVILPEHFGEVDDVRFEDGHFWLEDGDFLLAIRPLATRRWHADTPEFSILRSGPYRLLCLPNHEGEARSFSKEELGATVAGFVAVASSLRVETREAFRAKVMAARLHDTVWITQRTICWEGCGHTLELSYGLVSKQLRFAAIDGEEPATPAWEAKGLPRESLPLMAAKHQSNPHSFPYGPDANGWDEFPNLQHTGAPLSASLVSAET